MRVIAGEARGVPLVAPAGRGTRPTADRLKGAIFSALGDLGCRGRVLDLFAGSGALGIEALSRGAAFCDFVDSAPAACRAIQLNLAKTKLADQARVHCQPAARFIAAAPAVRQHLAGGRAPARLAGPYDLILVDPPYALPVLDGLLETLAASALVGERTALLVEHASRRSLPAALGRLAIDRVREHGDSAFTLYLPADEVRGPKSEVRRPPPAAPSGGPGALPTGLSAAEPGGPATRAPDGPSVAPTGAPDAHRISKPQAGSMDCVLVPPHGLLRPRPAAPPHRGGRRRRRLTRLEARSDFDS